MQNVYTHYWTNKQWKFEEAVRNNANSTLDHTAGNQFNKAGVKVGDIILIITVKKESFI